MKRFFYMILLLLSVYSCEKEVSRSSPTSPKPVAAKLIISSIPDGALIYLDGKTTGLRTPDTLDWLEVKKYTVTLKRELYRDTSFTVETNKDSIVSLLIDFNANPKMRGSITCVSTPDKADIFLNGKATGQITPHTFYSLIPGKYKIVLMKENARTDSIEATVRSYKNTYVVIHLVDTTYWVDYNTNTSEILDFAYNKIAIDRKDNLWLGSVLNGVVKYDGKTWVNYNQSNSGLVDNTINALKFDKLDNLWVCTSEGLSKFDGVNWTTYKKEQNNGFPDNLVLDIAFDLNGNPIVATYDGLARLKNDKWIVYRFDLRIAPSQKVNQNYFTGIDVDENGNWWAVRFKNGIAYWDGNSWHHYFTHYNKADDKANDPNIFYKSVAHTADNEIWFAHYIKPLNYATVGLSKYFNGLFYKLNYPDFFNVQVNTIRIKDGNEKWIASDAGLFRFVNYSDRIRYFQNNTILTTNKIQDVAFDSKGDAWVVTLKNGIYRFKLSLLK